MTTRRHPRYAGNLYERDALIDSSAHFRAIRDAGRLVWLSRHRLWAIGRYEDVRAALRAADPLISGEGVGANAIVNAIKVDGTLISDGEVHQRRRSTLIKPLGPRSIAALKQHIEEDAEALVLRLRGTGTFDAMPEFAAHLPVSIVAELVGLKPEGRQNMLRWAAATFDAVGPLNWRMLRALPVLIDLTRYAARVEREDVIPGSWAEQLFAAAQRGEISVKEAKAMIIDYVAPSLDTTILATGQLLRHLARHPDVLDAVRDDESRASSVVYESVRLSSPIRGFTRYAAADFRIGEQTLARGERVLVLFASANRDERKYPEPDRFDMARNPRDNVAWGHGEHICVGMHLARMEMESLLLALARHLKRIEVDEPVPLLNNVLQGFRALPARFH